MGLTIPWLPSSWRFRKPLLYPLSYGGATAIVPFFAPEAEQPFSSRARTTTSASRVTFAPTRPLAVGARHRSCVARALREPRAGGPKVLVDDHDLLAREPEFDRARHERVLASGRFDVALQLRERWLDFVIGQVILPSVAFIVGKLQRMDHADDAVIAHVICVIRVRRGRAILQRAECANALSRFVIMPPHQPHRERKQQRMLEKQFAP